MAATVSPADSSKRPRATPTTTAATTAAAPAPLPPPAYQLPAHPPVVVVVVPPDGQMPAWAGGSPSAATAAGNELASEHYVRSIQLALPSHLEQGSGGASMMAMAALQALGYLPPQPGVALEYSQYSQQVGGRSGREQAPAPPPSWQEHVVPAPPRREALASPPPGSPSGQAAMREIMRAVWAAQQQQMQQQQQQQRQQQLASDPVPGAPYDKRTQRCWEEDKRTAQDVQLAAAAASTAAHLSRQPAHVHVERQAGHILLRLRGCCWAPGVAPHQGQQHQAGR